MDDLTVVLTNLDDESTCGDLSSSGVSRDVRVQQKTSFAVDETGDPISKGLSVDVFGEFGDILTGSHDLFLLPGMSCG